MGNSASAVLRNFQFLRNGKYFTAFLVVWGYWISILLLNASLAIAITSYSTVFIPILKNQYYNIFFSSFIIIIISTISLSGIKGIGRFQFYTALIKLIPLILIIFLGFLFMNVEYFYPINISNETNFRAITITTTLTFFAFLGFLSLHLPGNVRCKVEFIDGVHTYVQPSSAKK